MTWTFTNLVVQIVTGILGAHAAAVAVHEHSFGALGHTVVGALGGGLSGYFLQSLASTMVTASGSLNQVSVVDQAVVQGLVGAVAGGILMLVVGLVKHSLDRGKSSG
jgi:uncharacterized membrane protein YeaQ/YmgE (transglycosylase-associated protein family)